MRDLLKLREVAGSVVVTLRQSILEPVGLKTGDRVLIEAAPPRRIVLTREGAILQSTARLELEIDLLEKRRQALESDLRYKRRQCDAGMPCDEGMSDPDAALLVLSSLERDRDQLDASISEKKLELYDLQGVELKAPVIDTERTIERDALRLPQRNEETHAAQIFEAAAILAGTMGTNTFSRVAVRDHLGLNNREWQSGYTAIFQGMRDDHPGGAPPVGSSYADVFHRVAKGTYELSAKGRQLAAPLVARAGV